MTDLEIAPCPFCGSRIRHIESWAKAFQPNRLYHEWHHELDNTNECPVRRHVGKIIASATDDPKMQAEAVALWNTRAPASLSDEQVEALRVALERIIKNDQRTVYVSSADGIRVDTARTKDGPCAEIARTALTAARNETLIDGEASS